MLREEPNRGLNVAEDDSMAAKYGRSAKRATVDAVLGEGEEAADEYKCMKLLAGNEGQGLMLELRFKTRNSIALPYSYLTKVTYDPSVGITIEFAGDTVQITGRNLDPVYHALVHHKAASIRERDETDDTLPNTECVVSRIVITQA